jgi:RNA polymerase primary sigma factor
MTELEFAFEPTDWSAVFVHVPRGGYLSAARFLMLMEGQPEDQVEEALLYLEASGICLDISDLPKPAAVGQAAVRLHREEQLAKAGTLRENLEENDPLRLYLEEVDGISIPSDMQTMARRYAGGYDQVLPGLTNGMLPTVVEMACRYTGRGVLLLDLIQEGSLGLWQGILSYRDGDFDTHARWWIQQYLARAVTLQARESGVGQKMKQAMEDFRAVDGRLLADLGRNATLAEIAQELHMSLEETRAVAGMIESARMLQSAKPEEKEEDPQEETQAVEDTAYFQMRQRVAELLGGLAEEDVTLLTLRFGLEGGLPLSPEETGRKLGLTPEEVVAREAAALARMRNN